MALFRRFNVGTSSYAHYNVYVLDRVSSTLVFVSCVGYTSIINHISKEIVKTNSTYAEGPGYSRTVSNGYDVEKRKQSNSDFMHMVAYRKDVIQEEERTNDERIISYIYCKNNDEKADRVFDKLYKNTAMPLLKEWVPYIVSVMEREGNLRQCTVYYDTSKEKPFDCFCINITRDTLLRIISNGLQTGLINVNGSNVSSQRTTEITGLDNYLNGYGEILATKIQESFVPKFVPGTSQYEERVDDYDDSCYEAGIEIYEAQKVVVQASVNNLYKNDVTFVIGEMGTGKTLIGAGITYAHHKSDGLTSVIMCPSHLTNKWKREVERFVPNAKGYIVRTLKQLLDLDKKIRDKDKKENMYIIISKESAKFGYEMRPAVTWSKSKRAMCCPKCGQKLHKVTYEGTGRNKIRIETPFGMRDMIKPYSYNAVCPNTKRIWNKQEHTWEEQVCGGKLWTPLNGDEETNWIKLGSEGWILKDHVHDIFNQMTSQTNLTRKDTSFLMRLTDIKNQLDNGQDPATSSRAPRKYPLAKYIREKYKGAIDYFIADEMNASPYTVMCM